MEDKMIDQADLATLVKLLEEIDIFEIESA